MNKKKHLYLTFPTLCLMVIYLLGPAPKTPKYTLDMPVVPQEAGALEQYIASQEAKHKLKPSELAFMGVKEAAGLLGPAAIGVSAAEEAVKDSKKGGGVPGRVISAQVLATDRDPYALTLLEWAVADDSSAVRVAVLKGLGERGNKETIPKLMPLLTDDRHAVRYMAAASIIKLSLK